MRERNEKKNKPFNKLKVYNFFGKPETDQKYSEMGLKKRKQINTENLKLFPEAGNQNKWDKLTVNIKETDP